MNEANSKKGLLQRVRSSKPDPDISFDILDELINDNSPKDEIESSQIITPNKALPPTSTNTKVQSSSTTRMTETKVEWLSLTKRLVAVKVTTRIEGKNEWTMYSHPTTIAIRQFVCTNKQLTNFRHGERHLSRNMLAVPPSFVDQLRISGKRAAFDWITPANGNLDYYFEVFDRHFSDPTFVVIEVLKSGVIVDLQGRPLPCTRR